MATKNKGIGSVSSLSEQHCTYTWTIDNYLGRCETVDNFRSPAFTAAGDDFKWCLEHKIFKSTFGGDRAFLILLPASDADFKRYSPVSGHLKASAIHRQNSLAYTFEKEGSFELTCNGLTRFELSFWTPFRSELRVPTTIDGAHFEPTKLATGDKFHIRCDLKYLKIKCNISSNTSTLSEPNRLLCDLERIRLDVNYSDATISVKGKKYPVHKVILAARSSVFDAMFKSNMQESRENQIVITDIDTDIFEEMLHYIYTGETKNLEVLAYELFPVADKYDLKGLKDICEQALIKELSVDNAGMILTLADMHCAEKLMENTIQFIKRNATNCEDFKNTKLAEILTTLRPELMKEVLDAIFE